jgi:hypothetical protein
MAKEEPILIDKTELILSPSAGGSDFLSIPYDKILRIEFRKCEEAKMFKKIPSEQIVFMIRGREDPVVINKSRVSEDTFEGYKSGLQKFAKDNRVSLASSL